ncbi:MAG: sigma-54 dependent transcriptional regulator [Candidatus Cryptobacteroides sp.]|nr:sigma-54 dependent transcriptional regulator [Bacteroidales bacterium]MDY3963650.1 sigma-54 dependent transcriptional regulator [Candidatus Cryptobacteroides sp.]
MDAQELQKLKNKYDIIGNDPALNRALEMAEAVAPTDLTVLVTGESGVGKDNIPRIIHQNSRRRNAKYFAVNCGAIPEGTIDSELFGHLKGSFTGAIDDRKGYFEVADGGTLFLDEIGELPLPSQAKLLRVLQSGEFIRVGDSKVSKTDVRVIAATNVDLLYAVSRGKFREDLYYRLNAIQIKMPSLRERKQDIYLLFRKFTSDFSEKYGMNKVTLTHDAIELLNSYRWPGNVRQLKNITETVSALEGQRLSPVSGKCEVNADTLSRYLPHDDINAVPVKYRNGSDSITQDEKQEIYNALYALNAEVSNLKKIISSGNFRPADPVSAHSAPAKTLPPSGHQDGYVSRPEVDWNKENDDVDIQEDNAPSHIMEVEPESEGVTISRANEEMIRKALDRHNGNRKKAAEELGISERTLYRKLPPEYRNQRKTDD